MEDAVDKKGLSWRPYQPNRLSELQVTAIDVGSWESDPDFAFHPMGSQPKRTLVCPSPPPLRYLLQGHRYIFKTVKRGWQRQQIWSEVIAYHVARLAGIDAPPCFIAYDPKSSETGVLMEFFYGYPGEKVSDRLVHASDYMHRLIKDQKRGRPHSLLTNIRICSALGLLDSHKWWAKTLTFDALIGNTDRHPDNWGFLVRMEADGTALIRLAPPFDNGTSLGYEFPVAKLIDMMRTCELETYILKGTHHCSWELRNDKPEGHLSLMSNMLGLFPDVSASIERVLNINFDDLICMLDVLSNISVSEALTPERAEFVVASIRMRAMRLTRMLECR